MLLLVRSESIRTGFLLSQGGEFAFVLLSLACQLKLLPEELNQILIITGAACDHVWRLPAVELLNILAGDSGSSAAPHVFNKLKEAREIDVVLEALPGVDMMVTQACCDMLGP